MNTKASPLAQPTAARQQAADTSDIVPTTILTFPASPSKALATSPAGPGIAIAGFAGRGLYRIVQSQSLEQRMAYLQSKTPFPLQIHVFQGGSYEETKAWSSRLRYLFKEKWQGNGWYTLSERDLAEAREYLAGEKARIAREAERARAKRAMVLERAARDKAMALDECVLLINRLRNLADVVRCFFDHERRTIHEWPQQALTDQCLEIVDGFGSALEELDLGLLQSEMEMQLALLRKKSGQRSK